MFSKAQLAKSQIQLFVDALTPLEVDYKILKATFDVYAHFLEEDLANTSHKTFLSWCDELSAKTQQILKKLDNLEDTYDIGTTFINRLIILKIQILALGARIESTRSSFCFIGSVELNYLFRAASLLDENMSFLTFANTADFENEAYFCLEKLLKLTLEGVLSWTQVDDYAHSGVKMGNLFIKVNHYCPSTLLLEEEGKVWELNLYSLTALLVLKCSSQYLKLIYYDKYFTLIMHNKQSSIENCFYSNLYLQAFEGCKLRYEQHILNNKADFGSKVECIHAHMLIYNIRLISNLVLHSKDHQKAHSELQIEFMKQYLLPCLSMFHQSDFSVLASNRSLYEFYCKIVLDLFVLIAQIIKDLTTWNVMLKSKTRVEKEYKKNIEKEIVSIYREFSDYIAFIRLFNNRFLQSNLPEQVALYDLITELAHNLPKHSVEKELPPKIVSKKPELIVSSKKIKKKPVGQFIQTKPVEPVVFFEDNEPPQEEYNHHSSLMNLPELNSDFEKAQLANNSKDYVLAHHHYIQAGKKALANNDMELQLRSLDGSLSLCVTQAFNQLKMADKLFNERLKKQSPFSTEKQNHLEKYIVEANSQLNALEKIYDYYHLLLLKHLASLPQEQHKNIQAAQAILCEDIQNIRTQVREVSDKYKQLRQQKSEERREFIMRLGWEKIAELPDNVEYTKDDAWNFGLKIYQNIGEKKKNQGQSVSDFSMENAFLESLEINVNTLSDTTAKLPAEHVNESQRVMHKKIKIILPYDIKYFFEYLQLHTGNNEHYLVGSMVLKLVLHKWKQSSLMEPKDYDFITTQVDTKKLIVAGFNQSTHKMNLFNKKIDGYPLELYCIDGDLEQSLTTRDFTITALAINADQWVIDPTGQGLADLKASLLRSIGDPVARIQSDPVIALRAVKYKCYGFTWDGALEHAIKNWMPDDKTNFAHLNAVLKKELKADNKTHFIGHLMTSGLLEKMFAVSEKVNVDKAILALEKKLHLETEAMVENPNRLFAHPLVQPSNSGSYRDKLIAGNTKK